MGDTCICLALCFNFNLHIMGLLEPVADVREQARAIADRALVAFGQPFLNFDEFRFHDPQLKIDNVDRDLQRGFPVGRCRVRLRARG
ncbi:MAG: hypothetical protein B7X55_00990 [Rhodobacterales bacterium 34-62-10]|nr:MAG: hypothetical protein B7X55_00990 [Rhodobacterales bacterium 34-62-10]